MNHKNLVKIVVKINISRAEVTTQQCRVGCEYGGNLNTPKS